MGSYKYTSVKTVFDQALRNPLLNGLSFEAMVDYTISFLHIVGVPAEFVDKLYTVDYDNYRAPIPEDFVECNQLLIDNIVAR